MRSLVVKVQTKQLMSNVLCRRVLWREAFVFGLLAIVTGVEVYGQQPRVQAFVPTVNSTGQHGPSTSSFTAIDNYSIRYWDSLVDSLSRRGNLVVDDVMPDTVIPDRTHERLIQYHEGVRVYGSEITRELKGGVTLSVGGVLRNDIDISTRPTLSQAEITNHFTLISLRMFSQPELVVYPVDDGTYHLAYVADVADGEGMFRYVVDAHSGDQIAKWTLLFQQGGGVSAVGTGILGDTKKVSVTNKPAWGVHLARDTQRPAELQTIDLGFDLQRGYENLFLGVDTGELDIASDSDNVWTDPIVVDMQAYLGWTYDYLYERFGRNGIDDQNSTIRAFVHWFRPEDYDSVPDVFRKFMCNAFYAPQLDVIFVGDGLPAHVDDCKSLAASLDVVAHELAHGVTSWTSNLVYENESGALNEAFSDILGVSADFFHAEYNNGLPYEANYRVGETSIAGGIRDLSDPGLFVDPDHYGARQMPVYSDSRDDYGFVHTNSMIAGHAFYLAVEGGRNRTSNQVVNGVGSAKRADIEKSFYRAFAYKLTPYATMRDARMWTIDQAVTPAARQAIREAWDAVGVFENQEVRIVIKDLKRSSSCASGYDMQWNEEITTGPSSFNVTNWEARIYTRQQALNKNVNGTDQISKSNAEEFENFFGSSSIPPRTTVTASVCWSSWGGSRIWLHSEITGAHDDGVQATHYAGRYYLR